MEIAAGIFLIIAGILNGFAAMAYKVKGVASKIAVEGSAFIEENNLIEGKTGLNPNIKFKAKLNTGYSIFLRLTVPMFILAAIFLFIDSYYVYALVIGALAIIIEIIGGFSFKFGPANVPGLLAGGLTLAFTMPIVFAGSQYINF